MFRSTKHPPDTLMPPSFCMEVDFRLWTLDFRLWTLDFRLLFGFSFFKILAEIYSILAEIYSILAGIRFRHAEDDAQLCANIKMKSLRKCLSSI